MKYIKTLRKNVAQVFVIAKYLSDVCAAIGKDAYLETVIRLQHCGGKGFAGVGNTGSTDCLKEAIRRVTDSLGQRYKTWQDIQFISDTCLNMPADPSFKSVYRVEHTREVSKLCEQFETEFILSGKTFTLYDIAQWIIENQVVCLIKQTEQKPSVHYDDNLPFSKYTSKIMYNGTDISLYTLAQIKALNLTRFAQELNDIKTHDFTKALASQNAQLHKPNGNHSLPPIPLVVQYHDDENELLYRHYRHKVNKFSDINCSWYNQNKTTLYENWKIIKGYQ